MKLSDFTHFIMNDGTVKCCGYNQYGQLGLGNTATPISTVTNLPFTGVKNIVCGYAHTFFMMEDGTVKCCGLNNNGQLGLGHTSSQVSTVVDLPLTGVKRIVCGGSFTLFIMTDGSVKACGYNGAGNLGLGHTTTPIATPTDLPFTGIRDVICGWTNTFFIMYDGSVKCCGNNNVGQLGLGHTTTPITSVTDLPFSGVKSIACGNHHTFFMMNDGTVKCCGHNQYGQLGLGYVTASPYAVSVVKNLPFTGVKKVLCSTLHTFFVMEDDTIKCCGLNDSGQLGLGNNTTPVSAVTNLPFSGVSSIVCGGYNTFFIMGSGVIKCCGLNNLGQLGLGNTNSPITTVTNFPYSSATKFSEWASFLKYSTEPQEILFSPIDTTWRAGISGILVTDSTGLVNASVFYAISMDSVNWYSYKNGSWVIVSDITTDGMIKSEIENITQSQFDEIFISGVLYIKAVLKTYDEYITPFISSLKVTLPLSYKVGGYYVHTNINQFNTIDWNKINGVTITQTTPTGTDVRYAFSRDNRVTWEVYDASWTPVPIGDIGSLGMTKEQVEALTPEQWSPIVWNNSEDILDVLVYLKSTDAEATPSVDQISINYDKIPSPVDVTSINVPVPAKGFRNVLINNAYTLKLAEGVAYDDAVVDYDFYTTPDRIKLRPLTIGTAVGGKMTAIYTVEVINTYESDTFDITLRASKAGQMAIAFPTYCMLPDAYIDTEKTVVEMSLTTNELFNPTYPLSFRLNPGEKRLVYIRVKPTLTTVGDDAFQINLSGRPV